MNAASQISATKQGQTRRKAGSAEVSHNLNGQKLGRKGQATRERILAATRELIEESFDQPLSLSAVARRAGLGMTSLYVYFADLTELVLALLEPVRDEAYATFVDIIRGHWPDDRLEEYCRTYIETYYAFWSKHSRILHLRNNMADQYDERMIAARVEAATPAIGLIRRQLMPEGMPVSPEADSMASVLMTGIERAVTVETDPVMPEMIERQFGPRSHKVTEPLARMLVLVIRDSRERARG